MKPINFHHIVRRPRGIEAHFTEDELEVIDTLIRIMNSRLFRQVRAFYQHSRSGSVVIAGLRVSYEESEDHPCGNHRFGISGFFGDITGFTLFCDAWISRSELITTIAHELYRLHFSALRNIRTFGVGDSTPETRDAETFSIAVAQFLQ